MRSLIAIGTDLGFSFASASACSSSKVRYAPTSPSAAFRRSITACVSSTQENSPFAIPSCASLTPSS